MTIRRAADVGTYLHISPQEEPMHDLAVGLAFIAMLLLPSCVAMHSMSRNSRDRVTSR